MHIHCADLARRIAPQQPGLLATQEFDWLIEEGIVMNINQSWERVLSLKSIQLHLGIKRHHLNKVPSQRFVLGAFGDGVKAAAPGAPGLLR